MNLDVIFCVLLFYILLSHCLLLPLRSLYFPNGTYKESNRRGNGKEPGVGKGETIIGIYYISKEIIFDKIGEFETITTL